MPDYSVLPAEILQMIMRDVGILIQNEKFSKRTISHHLLKCRLISKTLCMAATAVFASLVQQTQHADYQVLHLPPKSGNLTTLLKALTGHQTMYGSSITSIVYHISTGQDREIDDQQAFDYFCGCPYGHEDSDEDSLLDSETEERSCCRASGRIPWNISTYRRQCQEQDIFANHIGKNNAAALRTLLTSLPALVALKIEIKDFWADAVGLFMGSASEHETPARKAYLAIPVLLESLSASRATKITFEGFGSYAFGGLSPVKVSQLNNSKTFLQNITDLELDLSQNDELVVDFDCGEMSFGNIQRADRVSFFLHQLKRLRSLSLSCKDPQNVRPPVPKGSISDHWLRDVLERQRWPLLRSFSLQGFSYAYDNRELRRFLERHKSVLLNLVIRDITFIRHVEHDPVVHMLKVIRDNLQLSTASIMIDKSLDLRPELEIMLDSSAIYRESLVSPLWKVDIGALVVKPQIVEVADSE